VDSKKRKLERKSKCDCKKYIYHRFFTVKSSKKAIAVTVDFIIILISSGLLINDPVAETTGYDGEHMTVVTTILVE